MDEIILKLLIIIGACTVIYYGCKFAITILETMMKGEDEE